MHFQRECDKNSFQDGFSTVNFFLQNTIGLEPFGASDVCDRGNESGIQRERMKREREKLYAATVPPNGKTVHLRLSVYFVNSFSLRPKPMIYVLISGLFRPIFQNAS